LAAIFDHPVAFEALESNLEREQIEKLILFWSSIDVLCPPQIWHESVHPTLRTSWALQNWPTIKQAGIFFI